MMKLDVAVDVDAPPALVWAVLTDWERQPEWMIDARAVEVVTPEREGVGVTLRCPTRALGFTVEDTLRVTRWEPPRLLEVVHLGRIISGTAGFELADDDAGGSTVAWWEHVDPPLGRFGEIGAQLLVRPALTWLFSRNLARFRNLCETEAQVRSVTSEQSAFGPSEVPQRSEDASLGISRG